MGNCESSYVSAPVKNTDWPIYNPNPDSDMWGIYELKKSQSHFSHE